MKGRGGVSEIKTIIDAKGFRAVWVSKEQDAEDILEVAPLACWALVTRFDPKVDGTIPSVEGIAAITECGFCEDDDNFLGYAGPGETMDEIRQYYWHEALAYRGEDRRAPGILEGDVTELDQGNGEASSEDLLDDED